VLEEDDSGWVRRNALIALAKLDAADEDTYVDCIKTDPHPSVREYGAQYLRTGQNTERCVRILSAVLAREPNAYVRVKTAESLGEFGTERAEEALERFGAQDASDDVRRTAKQALARARGVDPDALELEDVAAPGTGPNRPEHRQAGPQPEGGVPEYRQGGNGRGSGPGRPPTQRRDRP
jgi:HEAT repeat protein